jgi:hypothetical protein
MENQFEDFMGSENALVLLLCSKTKYLKKRFILEYQIVSASNLFEWPQYIDAKLYLNVNFIFIIYVFFKFILILIIWSQKRGNFDVPNINCFKQKII